MKDADLSVWLVNAVIAFTLLEGVFFLLMRRLAGRGLALADVVANLGAGLCLLGALRSVLGQAGWMPCALWLAAAGLSHALDVRRRWPGPARQDAADSSSRTQRYS
ncbi:MAG TPA: hypothetical protein VH328_14315 [Burkholderiaceae bacterium]|jgi:hypothetical protein|nr:hypothetical protein [Burkholderiaceae bacterium]